MWRRREVDERPRLDAGKSSRTSIQAMRPSTEFHGSDGSEQQGQRAATASVADRCQKAGELNAEERPGKGNSTRRLR